MTQPDATGLDRALPIAPVLGNVCAALRDPGQVVLQAPPGAGKTTQVPLAILADGFVSGRILMLEPRRVAARAAADRLADALGERVGVRVGYRIRGQSKPGSAIEVVTEGILTRMIQSDPELTGIGCVIFDEFHERSLQADLGLAFCLEIREALRPDLKLVVMSATLDAAPVAALMGDAPIVTAEGRAFEVETRWLPVPWQKAQGAKARLEQAVAGRIRDAMAETSGGVLAFLPGRAEIDRTMGILSGRVAGDVDIQPLHGGLSLERQRAALSPLASGRKLVLATSIAETSVTIPDIRVVVDAGLARRSIFDPGSGMSRLITQRVTRAEAEQRRGRAGRVAEGWCYRLWTKGEEGGLAAFAPPEITVADLTPLVLEMALWGAFAPTELPFLTPPPEAQFCEAQTLLRDLGLLDAQNKLTTSGRALAALPVHPRLGHMLSWASAAGAAKLGADLSALCEGRDPLRSVGRRAPVDLSLRLKAMTGAPSSDLPAGVELDRDALRTLRDDAKRLAQLLDANRQCVQTPPSAAEILSLAYPDRIGKHRGGQGARYLLSGGKGAHLPPDAEQGPPPYIVAADLDGNPREATIRKMLPITEAEILAAHGDRIETRRICEWSRRTRAIMAVEQACLGALVLDERPWKSAPSEDLVAAALAGLRDLGLEVLNWSAKTVRLAARVEWVRAHGAAEHLPDMSRGGLLAAVDDWLAPYLMDIRRMEDFAKVDLHAALSAYLGWDGMTKLDDLAPSSIAAPTGTVLPIDYNDPGPSVSVRVQEMFGLTAHPTIGADRVPLIIHLLSPARRPVQTTSDLPGFWKNSYRDLRKDLRGRYIKHFWPEDPANAKPTRGVRKRET